MEDCCHTAPVAVEGGVGGIRWSGRYKVEWPVQDGVGCGRWSSWVVQDGGAVQGGVVQDGVGVIGQEFHES